MAKRVIRIIFDGPPGPEGGRFIECEDDQGQSIELAQVGQLKEIDGGLWELRIECSAAD